VLKDDFHKIIKEIPTQKFIIIGLKVSYGGFTPLGREWLSDEYDFKQSSTLISIRFRVKNLHSNRESKCGDRWIRWIRDIAIFVAVRKLYFRPGSVS